MKSIKYVVGTYQNFPPLDCPYYFQEDNNLTTDIDKAKTYTTDAEAKKAFFTIPTAMFIDEYIGE